MSGPPQAEEPPPPGRPRAAGPTPGPPTGAPAAGPPPPAAAGDGPPDGPTTSGAAAAAEAGGGDAAGGGLPSRDDAAEEAARRVRAERAIRGTLSGALVLEALMVLFVPRAIAPLSDGGLTGGRLAFLLGLAGALVLGTVLQLPVIAAGFLVGAMFVLGLVFAGVWLYLLRVRQDLLQPARPPAAS